MKLANAARHFDRSTFADAYDPAATFLGQLAVFDDVLRDSLTASRRILSVAADVAIPARRTITADGLVWLVGERQPDYFDGAVIRNKYVLQQAGATALKTFAQVLGGQAGTPLYAARNYIKTLREVDQSSLELGLYELFFSSAESPLDYQMVQLGGRWHLLRIVHPSEAGFTAALADELLEPVVVTASWTAATYDPVADTRSGTPASVPALLLRWQSYFTMPVAASAKFERGDDIVILRKSDGTPKAGDSLIVAGVNYHLISKLDQAPVWSCHVRRT